MAETTAVAEKAGDGESLSERKRAQILEAASAVFLRDGYGTASMDTITRTANVSKATVYNHFPSKEALFGAIIHKRCQEQLEGLPDPNTDGRSARELLTRLARNWLGLLICENGLGIHRIVLAEAQRFPEMADIFYRSGPARMIKRVAELIEIGCARGELAVENPDKAAAHFIGLIKDPMHLRVLLGLEPPPSQAVLQRQVEECVEVFFRAYAPR